MEVIKQARPDLKPSTVKNYATQLRKMEKLFGVEFVDKDPQEIVDGIHNSGLSSTYQRNLFQVTMVLMISMDKEKYAEEIKVFRAEMDKLNKKYVDDNSGGTLVSKNQQANMISYEELRNYIDRVKADIGKEEMLHIVYVVLESLFRVPVRLDHAGLIFIGKRAFKHLTLEERNKHNYLVETRGNKGKFTFAYYQDERTTKTRPAEFQDLPKDLEKIWKKYLRVMKYKHGDVVIPLTRNHLSQVLRQTSERYIDKHIGSTLIRKIVISEKFGSVKEMKAKQSEFAKAVGHSVEVEDLVYNKK